MGTELYGYLAIVGALVAILAIYFSFFGCHKLKVRASAIGGIALGLNVAFSFSRFDHSIIMFFPFFFVGFFVDRVTVLLCSVDDGKI